MTKGMESERLEHQGSFPREIIGYTEYFSCKKKRSLSNKSHNVYFSICFRFRSVERNLMFFTISIERGNSFQYRLEISFREVKALYLIVETIIRFFSNYSLVCNRKLEKASHRISHMSSSRVSSNFVLPQMFHVVSLHNEQ
jgi:hypothetical protein